jgi:hypothetical protein
MFVGQEWRTQTDRAPAASIESWGSLCKGNAGLLIVGERDGNMPRRHAPKPPHRARPERAVSPLGSQSKPTSFQPGGLSRLSLTFSLKIRAAPLFTLPSVSHPRTYFAYFAHFLRTPLKVTVPRDICLMIAFFELVGQGRRTGRKVCV